jgi:hypothetical protein
MLIRSTVTSTPATFPNSAASALLERAAKLMVKAGYRAYGVRIKVAGKEKGYGSAAHLIPYR